MPGAFLVGSIWIMDAVALLAVCRSVQIFRFFLCHFSMCVCLETFPFHLGHLVCWHITVHSIPLKSFISAKSVGMFPLSFLVFVV